jgi:hypothetical protein
MHKISMVLICAALSLGAVAGCDDSDGGKPHVRSAKTSGLPAARAGGGWRAVADAKISAWSFAPPPADAEPQRSASWDSIHAALDARMLPPRDSVRIAELIGRVSGAAPARDPATSGGSAMPVIGNVETVVTTSPWNDNTWLLWVAISGLDRPAGRKVHIAFDPRSIAFYRPLGDPAALPDPQAVGGRAQMLYELSPVPDAVMADPAVYATLQAGSGADRQIGPGNFVDSIDDAPDIVRFATAVAGFAELLRGDPAVRDLSCAEMIALAEGADEPDPGGVRAEMIKLMKRAEPLIDQPPGDTATAAQDDAGK